LHERSLSRKARQVGHAVHGDVQALEQALSVEAQMEARLRSSGRNNATKRSVSETKKKFVAAQQSWKCGHCDRQLPAWYEVDHIVRLEHGGSNNVDNLVALCRDCHGKKTAMETF
jgi:5-methylcytosine-specific restriction endonuclease McrA